MLDLSDPLVRATLIRLAEVCNYSPRAHCPEGKILTSFASHDKGEVKKILKKLVKEGYAHLHPTGRNMTYNISKSGLSKAQIF